MTKAELLQQLESFDDEDTIVFGYSSNDYWNTQLASHISEIDNGFVRHSEYHRTLEQVDEEKYDEQEEYPDPDIPKNKIIKRVILLK